MRTVTITGDLVTVDMTSPDQDTEGEITIFADSGRQKTQYQVQIPSGMMDMVMPGHWNRRVNATVLDDPQLGVYTLQDIGEASGDEPQGIRDKREEGTD